MFFFFFSPPVPAALWDSGHGQCLDGGQAWAGVLAGRAIFFQGSQEQSSRGALPWNLVIATERRELGWSAAGLWKTVEDFAGEGWGELD